MHKRGGRILVIDDNQDVLNRCQQELQRIGFAVQANTTAEPLSVLLQPLALDLALIDLHCVRQNACALLFRLRDAHPDIPLILMVDAASANGSFPAPSFDLLAAATRAGVQNLLPKPFTSAQLHQAINETLHSWQTQRTAQHATAAAHLHDFRQALRAEQQPRQVSEQAARMVRDVYAAEWAVLLNLSADGNGVEMMTSTGSPATQENTNSVPTGSLCSTVGEWVLRYRQTLRVPGNHSVPLELRDVFAASPSCAVLAVPLSDMVGHPGALVIGSSLRAAAFTAADEQLAVALADEIAAVLALLPVSTAPVAHSGEMASELLWQTNDAVWLLDSTGSRILDANPAAERMSGYSRGELLAMAPCNVLTGLYHEFLPDEPDAAPVSAPQEGVYSWLPTGTEAMRPVLRPRDGHLLPLSVRVDRLTQAGETYLLVVARDMSGCWEQAHNLFQNEKLAAIGRLMSGIAHEMNNPLQAIYNTLSLLTNNTVNGDNIEKRKHYLMMSRQEVEHLIGMVQRVLDIYRPTRDGMREVNLHDLLQAVTPVIRQQQQDYDVLVLYELQPDLPLIQGIASHLKQVYESLIINAMESMSPGGVLTIRSYMTYEPPNHDHELNAGQFIQSGRGTEQHQTWQPDQPLVVVEFSDTGRGIPSDELCKVFEPFYTTRSNGVGLSLAMCYGIVEQHNGRLAVSSVVGRGTTVRLYLPVMP